MEKKKDKKERSITGSFLGGIPVLGGFFEELGKTEIFKKRFEEVDEKIKENIKKGEKKGWYIESNISVRPIISEVKKETSEISLHEDYFYGRKGNKLILAVKVPEEGVNWKIEGKTLFITAENFKKEIELPDNYREINKRKYKKGVLVLELK